MRRMSIVVLLAGLFVAGCGSSSPSSSGMQRTELSYFPASSPFVAVIATDPNGKPVQDANSFLGQFPLAKLGIAALESKIAQQGINYERDIKPLLGNPVALGSSTSSLIGGQHFLVVFIAKDTGKLKALLTRKPGPQAAGSYDGAQLYQSSSAVFAVDGATALLAPTVAEVKAALDRHAHGGGISDGDFSRAFTGLPQNTLVQLYGNLTGLLSTSKAAMARLIPWVAAIRSYAVAAEIGPTRVTVNFNVNTPGSALSAEQLPLASGATPPNVSGQSPVAFGLRDLSHVVKFVIAAEQAASPSAYARFLKREASLRAKTGVDLNTDVIGQLSGNLEVDYGATGLLARAQVADPAAATRTLAKLSSSASTVFPRASSVKRTSDGFYALKTGTKTINVGLVGNELVVGTDSAAHLRAFAGSVATPIVGAQGPVAFRVSVGAVVSLALNASHHASALPPAAQSILNMFGDVTGWAANDASGLHGAVTIPLK